MEKGCTEMNLVLFFTVTLGQAAIAIMTACI